MTFSGGVSMSSAETYPTIAEAMTAAALKLLDMPERLKALDETEALEISGVLAQRAPALLQRVQLHSLMNSGRLEISMAVTTPPE